MNSARRRRLVIGVRRSCDTAASSRVRSATKRSRRSCMRLKARVVRRTSSGPSSGTGPGASPRPKRSAASARRFIGRVTRRTTSTTTRTTASAMAPRKESEEAAQPGGRGGGPALALSQRFSSSRTEISSQTGPCQCRGGRPSRRQDSRRLSLYSSSSSSSSSSSQRSCQRRRSPKPTWLARTRTSLDSSRRRPAKRIASTRSPSVADPVSSALVSDSVKTWRRELAAATKRSCCVGGMSRSSSTRLAVRPSTCSSLTRRIASRRSSAKITTATAWATIMASKR